MSSDYADMLTILGTLFSKFDRTVLLRKQGVITTDTNIEPGMKMSTTLTDDNVTGDHFLPAVHFHAQSLTF